jgi:uncharacterized membrane protein
MKKKQQTSQNLTEKALSSSTQKHINRTDLPPLLETLFGASTASGAIGGALLGSLVSLSWGSLIGGTCGGVIGFITDWRKNGHTPAI